MPFLDSWASFLKRGEQSEITYRDEEIDVEEQSQETRYSLTEMGQQQKDIYDELGQRIKIASEGALAPKTVATYRSLWRAFVAFIDGLENSEFKRALIEPNETTPNLIAAWIYHKCEKRDISDSATALCQGASFSHALKMRAAVSYFYAQNKDRGTEKWHNDENGNYSGNPALSHIVSRYMISLQKRKIKDGDVAQSARSITSTLLKKLYEKNDEFKMKPFNTIHLHSEDQQWAGPRLRIMLQCIYAIAFLCLLRFDEVLRIELKDIEVMDKLKGRIKLTLPFRKTHQCGDIKPFHLYFNRRELHLDPVHLLLRWIHVSRLTTGPLFRRIDAQDRMPINTTKALTSEQFMEYFKNNLIDINEDPTPYGTHSFRRGGCQYLSSERRWDIRKLCDWGGWSLDFDNVTIMRYLMSWNDCPTRLREDFMDPEKQVGNECGYCGRTCDCA